MYYVYVLKSGKDHKLYTGYTNDLRRRLAEHTNGDNRATYSRLPMTLLYYEAYTSRADAKARESRLKTSAGARIALKRRLQFGLR